MYYLIDYTVYFIFIISVLKKTKQLKSVLNNSAEKLVIFILFLIYGTAYQFGTDWYGYYNYFYNLNGRNLEIGYKYLNVFFSFVGFNYQELQLFLIAIILILIYKNCKKYSLKNNFFYLLFLLLHPLIYILRDMYRQGIAVCFIWIGISYLDKNKIKAIILILLAVSFHRSAFIVIFILFFLKLLSVFKFKLKINKKTILCYIVLYFILFFLNSEISKILINYFSFFKGMKIIDNFIRYSILALKNYEINKTFLIKGLEFIFMMCLYYKNKLKNNYENYAIVYIFMYSFFSFQGNLNRLSWYFYIFYANFIIEILDKYIVKFKVLYMIYILVYYNVTIIPRNEAKEKYIYYNYYIHKKLLKKEISNKIFIENQWNQYKKENKKFMESQIN